MRRVIVEVTPSEVSLYQQNGWNIFNDSDPNKVYMNIDAENGKTYIDTDWVKPHDPYLIQRGLINRPLGDSKGKRFFQTVNFDYMGSAEFEFGALPASLNRLRVLNFKAKLHKFDGITYNGQPLRIWTYYEGEQLEIIKKNLLKLRGGETYTKEWTYFANDMNLSKCDLWWDIKNDVIFSFDKLYMNRLQQHLGTSFEAMNVTAAATAAEANRQTV